MKTYGNPESLSAAPNQVQYETSDEGRIAWITLNRLEKHNALSVPMRARISQLVHEAEADPQVRVVVFRGNGKSFCSGNEINEKWGQRKPGDRRMSLTTAYRYATDMVWGRQGFSQSISRCTKITVMQLHGFCAAAAYFMFAMKVDMVLVGEGAKVGALEARFLGPASAVASIHINRILGTRAARRSGYTAEAFTGPEAVRLGLAHECVPDGELPARTLAIAQEMAARPAHQVRYRKARVLAGEGIFDTAVPAMTGLLFSHFLQAETDESHFWTDVRKSGIGGALDADKARRAAIDAQVKGEPT